MASSTRVAVPKAQRPGVAWCTLAVQSASQLSLGAPAAPQAGIAAQSEARPSEAIAAPPKVRPDTPNMNRAVAVQSASSLANPPEAAPSASDGRAQPMRPQIEKLTLSYAPASAVTAAAPTAAPSVAMTIPEEPSTPAATDEFPPPPEQDAAIEGPDDDALEVGGEDIAAPEVVKVADGTPFNNMRAVMGKMTAVREAFFLADGDLPAWREAHPELDDCQALQIENRVARTKALSAYLERLKQDLQKLPRRAVTGLQGNISV